MNLEGNLWRRQPLVRLLAGPQVAPLHLSTHTHGTPAGIMPRSTGTGYSPSTLSHRSRSQGSTAASGLEREHVRTSLQGPAHGQALRDSSPPSHSPQLMLVITQAHGQEGTAPKL